MQGYTAHIFIFWAQCRGTLRTFLSSVFSAGLHCAHFYFLSAVQVYTAHIFIFGLQCRATLRTFLFFERSSGLHCAHKDHNRLIFVPLWQNGQERENSKNFQLYIVKSSFSDVKTYEKLTFFIIFLDWHKIMFNHAEW